MTLLAPALSGFLLGLGLIVAIGAQNAYVLRLGLLRAHVFPVATLCFLADAILIGAGVLGAGALVNAFPRLLFWITLAGAGFLIVYGLLAARRALDPGRLRAADAARPPLREALLTAAAFTFLNPHVYLDTVVLAGGISARYAGAGAAAFWAGAASASAVWFYGLGYGARLLTPLFAKEGAWRVLDAAIAVVMFAIAASLLRGVL